jgi:hypothetical protein
LKYPYSNGSLVGVGLDSIHEVWVMLVDPRGSTTLLTVIRIPSNTVSEETRLRCTP